MSDYVSAVVSYFAVKEAVIPLNQKHMVLNMLLSECALFNKLGNCCFAKQLGLVTKSRTSEI